LYGCETWSPTLREEYRLKSFENRVLKRISGLKIDEIIGDWEKVDNEELRNMYPPINTESRRMSLPGM
jgi:hypothetical protein